ncbi:MAG TPA: polysaccharide pyruvyl transferase family protein [Vicinamibacterales bacterium]|nr:polysaccharide pyruvyl transferase family protein [Vicinamibacterales bacterium]
MPHHAVPSFRIGISGSYGGLNLGDEAILEVILAGLRAAVKAEVTVFSRNVEDTRRRHDVDRVVAVRDLTRQEVSPEVERLDLLILGGGGILFDAEAEIVLREAQIAFEKDVPVLVYAVSVGPLDDANARKLVRDALGRATVVTVRDRQSRKLLEQIGVARDVRLTADPALLLQPAPVSDEAFEAEGLASGRRTIGISVRERGAAAPDLDEGRYHQLLANAADYLVDRLDADLLFFPLERNVLDLQQSHAVISHMAYPQRAHVLKGEYGSGELLSLIGRLEFAVGMRLHFLIFSAIQRVPFVALPYSGKVSGFIEDLEMRLPAVQEMRAGQLIAYLDRSWDFREELRAQIDRHLPGLQQRASETTGIAVELLQRRGGGR